MDKMKMLSEEQLENVSGGGSYASADYLPATHGAHIRAKEFVDHPSRYIGKRYYCVQDSDNSKYLVVILYGIDHDRIKLSLHDYMNIYEDIVVEQVHGDFGRSFDNHLVYTINSKDYTFYEYE